MKHARSRVELSAPLDGGAIREAQYLHAPSVRTRRVEEWRKKHDLVVGVRRHKKDRVADDCRA